MHEENFRMEPQKEQKKRRGKPPATRSASNDSSQNWILSAQDENVLETDKSCK